MCRYEISYRDNGILKNKGFGYRDKFEKFLARLLKNPSRYSEIRTYDGDYPSWDSRCWVNY